MSRSDRFGLDTRVKFWIQLGIAVFIPTIAILISMILPGLTLATIVSALIALVLLYLSLMYRDITKEVSTRFDTVISDLDELIKFAHNQAVIRPVWEANFYESWLADMEDASQSVAITYFDNKDPRESEDDGKVSYYRNVGDVIKRKSKDGVKFRRIIRAIPELETWVDDIIEEHRGTHNYSLVCIPDEEPDVSDKPHVSVQLVDDDITYFVAVGEQIERSQPRDMYVRSEEMNQQWTRYFETLWDSGFEVLRKGKVQEEELEDFKSHIRRIQDDD